MKSDLFYTKKTIGSCWWSKLRQRRSLLSPHAGNENEMIHLYCFCFLDQTLCLYICKTCKLWLDPKHNPQTDDGTYKPSKPYYYSEVYQKKRKADLFDFNKELALLYDLSEKDKNSAIYKAKELIKNYTLPCFKLKFLYWFINSPYMMSFWA